MLGKYFSNTLNKYVYVSKVTRSSDIPFDRCELCGKYVTRSYYSVVDYSENCCESI